MAQSSTGLICLGEAANFGDDLIMIAGVAAIAAGHDDVEVRYLSFGHPVNWGEISTRLGLRLDPRPVRYQRELPGSRRSELAFGDCDALLVGGGGLFQTSHHPHTPYLWLSYLPRHLPAVPVLGVGLGLGPLSDDWSRRLRRLGSPFDECYLRDGDSVALAEERLGWRVRRCRDFVDHTFLRQLGIEAPRGTGGSGQLGVALRRWPGLEVGPTVRHIARIAESSGTDTIRVFVLEAGAHGPDVSFSEQVGRGLGRDAEVVPYRGSDLVAFADAMARCTVAVSMKLHSSALWGALGVPIFPISYAPKTAAFFGQPFRGLTVYDRILPPAVEPEAVPRAADVVGPWIGRALAGAVRPARAVLPRAERLRLQTSSTAINVYRQLGRGLKERGHARGAVSAMLPPH
ncbi:polysaccharide pyruvyl transferase family protein [Micromonospora sp. NPDC048999]|uniref:polysaccharide pyruvyl transferase family protein n=1 Tax=Micromonospora sp. NPDC048999 TaxID=3155391 RepID=UPI00340445BD